MPRASMTAIRLDCIISPGAPRRARMWMLSSPSSSFGATILDPPKHYPEYTKAAATTPSSSPIRYGLKSEDVWTPPAKILGEGLERRSDSSPIWPGNILRTCGEAMRGEMHHLDFSVSDCDAARPVYELFLTHMGYSKTAQRPDGTTHWGFAGKLFPSSASSRRRARARSASMIATRPAFTQLGAPRARKTLRRPRTPSSSLPASPFSTSRIPPWSQILRASSPSGWPETRIRLDAARLQPQKRRVCGGESSVQPSPILPQ